MTDLSLPEQNIIDQAAAFSTPQRAAYVNEVETYEDQINQLIADEGIYSEALINYYLAAAHIYKENSQYEKALAGYNSSLQLIRIEYGLDTELQIPVLEAIADTQINSSQYDDAYSTLNSILKLKLKNSNDPLLSLRHSLEHSDQLLTIVQHSYNRNSIELEDALELLLKANLGYSRGVNFILPNTRNNPEILKALNDRIAIVSYYQQKIYDEDLNKVLRLHLGNKHDDRFRPENLILQDPYLPEQDKQDDTMKQSTDTVKNLSGQDMNILINPLLTGIYSLQTNLDYVLEKNDSVEAVLEAKLKLADWYQLAGYSHTKDARQLYQNIYLQLKSSDSTESHNLIQDIFTPAIPVQIPAYIPPDYSSESYGFSEEPRSETFGFIDTSFIVDRNGHTRKIKTLYKSPGLEMKYEELLIEDLEKNQYRPAFEDGQPIRKSYSLRYYVKELE